jgi:hypothetical protein
MPDKAAKALRARKVSTAVFAVTAPATDAMAVAAATAQPAAPAVAAQVASAQASSTAARRPNVLGVSFDIGMMGLGGDGGTPNENDGVDGKAINLFATDS